MTHKTRLWSGAVGEIEYGRHKSEVHFRECFAVYLHFSPQIFPLGETALGKAVQLHAGKMAPEQPCTHPLKVSVWLRSKCSGREGRMRVGVSPRLPCSATCTSAAHKGWVLVWVQEHVSQFPQQELS